MKKIYYIIGITLFLIFTCCSKSQISCEITDPPANSTFALGDIIELAVIANAEVTTVSEVQLYLDNIPYQNKMFFPYNFQIHTDNLKEGVHIVRAVAIADDGNKSEATLPFNLVKYESPDFVTFSDGKFPIAWKRGGWSVFSPGFDDNYSIRVSAFLAGNLSTVKTCDANINCIEFYAKDEIDNWLATDLSFFIDGTLIKTITLTQSWEKYSFEIPPGTHTFQWWLTHVGEDCSSYLDAIRFLKKQK